MRHNVEAVVERYSVKKVFLKISQNSQRNTCARYSFLIKLQACNCFPVNFVKFLRRPFFIEYLRCLLLNMRVSGIIYSNNSSIIVNFKYFLLK